MFLLAACCCLVNVPLLLDDDIHQQSYKLPRCNYCKAGRHGHTLLSRDVLYKMEEAITSPLLAAGASENITDASQMEHSGPAGSLEHSLPTPKLDSTATKNRELIFMSPITSRPKPIPLHKCLVFPIFSPTTVNRRRQPPLSPPNIQKGALY